MKELPDLNTLSHAEKDALIMQLWAMVQALTGQVDALTAEVAELKGRLIKDSHNSSKPSGLDVFRKPKSQRLPSGKKPGGQRGHPGSTLKRVAQPDRSVDHPPPPSCDACGAALVGTVAVVETRQVMELPPLAVEVVEHRRLARRCVCGKLHRGEWPADVTEPMQYGPRLKALAVYLTQYQMLPVLRSAELLRDLWGAPISAASIDAYATAAGATLAPVVDRIRHAVAQAGVAHFDESGLRVAGTLHWLHTAATPRLSWYGHHARRGGEAIEHFDILTRFNGVAVHDGFAPYRDYACHHALCNAHHLRELIWLDETSGQTWSRRMIHLLTDAKAAAEGARGGQPSLTPAAVAAYHQRFEALLAEGRRLNPERPKAAGSRRAVKQSPATNLLKRLTRYRTDVLRFLSDPRVPFDNNLAERAIRMPKLKQKISGSFRSDHGADTFCAVRSYLATLRKQGLDLVSALTKTFQGAPPLPSFSP